MNQIQAFIKNSEELGACSEELKVIKECSSLEEVLLHPLAPFWVFWYAKNVIKGRWKDGEEVIKTSPKPEYMINGRYQRSMERWRRNHQDIHLK